MNWLWDLIDWWLCRPAAIRKAQRRAEQARLKRAASGVEVKPPVVSWNKPHLTKRDGLWYVSHMGRDYAASVTLKGACISAQYYWMASR